MLLAALLGCVSVPGGEGTESLDETGAGSGTGNPVPVAGDTAAKPPGVDAGVPESGGTEPKVLMLGRSVSYAWAEYMGLEWQEDESYRGRYDGKDMRYREVSPPPDISESAASMLDQYDSDVVFFKLCFVDFGQEEGEMLAENEEYVRRVYEEAVTKRHRRLIIGNALPQVGMYASDGLRSNQREYNRWLSAFASMHPDVQVLDLYGMLADSDGSLKGEYAASPDDSHLNGRAYAKITPALMEAIENAG